MNSWESSVPDPLHPAREKQHATIRMSAAATPANLFIATSLGFPLTIPLGKTMAIRTIRVIVPNEGEKHMEQKACMEAIAHTAPLSTDPKSPASFG